MNAGSGRHVAVVGGGVIGLNGAVSLLAQTSQLSVTVLERDIIGRGASQYAGAMDLPYFRNGFQRDLVQTSWTWHETRGAAEYRRMVPITWFVEHDLDLQSSMIIPLSGEPTEASRCWTAPTGACSLASPSFVIDSSAWCWALAREIQQSGRGSIIEKSDVIRLEHDPHNRLRLLCADGRSCIADHVVLALGPWLPGWDDRTRAWAASIGLRTKRVFGLNVEVSGGPYAAVGWPKADIYFHPAPGASANGKYCLSLRHDEWDMHPDGEHRMIEAVLERARAFLNQLLGCGAWKITGHRVFVDSYTPDFQAFVGTCSVFGPDITIATGTHGSGVRMAPGIAKLITHSVVNRLARQGYRLDDAKVGA